MNSKTFFTDLISKLNIQKNSLGISFAALSKQTDISMPTLKRIFSGKHNTAHLDHILRLTEVLGIDLSLRLSDPEKIRRKQAEKKAQYIMELVSGNSALEDQHVSKKAYKTMMKKTVSELLLGPNKNLWAE